MTSKQQTEFLKAQQFAKENGYQLTVIRSGTEFRLWDKDGFRQFPNLGAAQAFMRKHQSENVLTPVTG